MSSILRVVCPPKKAEIPIKTRGILGSRYVYITLISVMKYDQI